MTGSESDQASLFVHLAFHIDQPDPAQFPDIYEPDLHALLGERQPGIDVGRVIVEVDKDVIMLPKF